MGLFSDVHVLMEEFPFTISIFPANRLLTVLVLPHPREAINKCGIVPLDLRGTPAELDEEFLSLLRDYRLRHIPLSHQAALAGAEIEKSKDALKSKSQRGTGDRPRLEQRPARDREVVRTPPPRAELPAPAPDAHDATPVPAGMPGTADAPVATPQPDAQSPTERQPAQAAQQDMFGGFAELEDAS